MDIEKLDLKDSPIRQKHFELVEKAKQYLDEMYQTLKENDDQKIHDAVENHKKAYEELLKYDRENKDILGPYAILPIKRPTLEQIKEYLKNKLC